MSICRSVASYRTAVPENLLSNQSYETAGAIFFRIDLVALAARASPLEARAVSGLEMV